MQESLFLNPTKTLLAAGLGEGERVADFGAGSGFFTRAAARIVGPSASVWAVDMQADLLSRIKNLGLAEGLHNIEVLRGDLEAPKGSHLPDYQTDFCIATNVLFSVEDKQAFATEITRVLKRGGRALIIDWRGSFDGMGPHPDHVITVGKARDLLEKCGLFYVRDVPAGEFHWGFIVRKNAD